MPRQLSCHGMCKIMSWSHHYFSRFWAHKALVKWVPGPGKGLLFAYRAVLLMAMTCVVFLYNPLWFVRRAVILSYLLSWVLTIKVLQCFMRLCIIYVREDSDSNVWLHCLYGLYGPQCPMSGKKRLNLITYSSLTHSWDYAYFKMYYVHKLLFKMTGLTAKIVKIKVNLRYLQAQWWPSMGSIYIMVKCGDGNVFETCISKMAVTFARNQWVEIIAHKDLPWVLKKQII